MPGYECNALIFTGKQIGITVFSFCQDVEIRVITNERRREIIFNEMSFLDRKRQNADPETARPMTRTVFGKTYTLPVGDPHYQLPIPLNVMNMNKLLIQNER